MIAPETLAVLAVIAVLLAVLAHLIRMPLDGGQEPRQ